MTKKRISIAISPTAYAVIKAEAEHNRRSVNIWLDYHLEAVFPTVWEEAKTILELKKDTD